MDFSVLTDFVGSMTSSMGKQMMPSKWKMFYGLASELGPKNIENIMKYVTAEDLKEIEEIAGKIFKGTILDEEALHEAINGGKYSDKIIVCLKLLDTLYKSSKETRNLKFGLMPFRKNHSKELYSKLCKIYEFGDCKTTKNLETDPKFNKLLSDIKLSVETKELKKNTLKYRCFKKSSFSINATVLYYSDKINKCVSVQNLNLDIVGPFENVYVYDSLNFINKINEIIYSKYGTLVINFIDSITSNVYSDFMLQGLIYMSSLQDIKDNLTFLTNSKSSSEKFPHVSDGHSIGVFEMNQKKIIILNIVDKPNYIQNFLEESYDKLDDEKLKEILYYVKKETKETILNVVFPQSKSINKYLTS